MWPLHYLPMFTCIPILPGSVIRILRHIRIRLPLLSVISLVPAPTPFHVVCAVAGVLMCLLSSPPPTILHFQYTSNSREWQRYRQRT